MPRIPANNELFTVIGITTPDATENPKDEAEAISHFLTSGAIDLFHIRKPQTDEKYVSHLLDFIPKALHGSLVLHSHYSLFSHYDFGGLHFKPGINIGIHFSELKDKKIISKSCHSLDEIRETDEEFSYRFLSPIFDSISKIRYKSAFSVDDPSLKEAVKGKKIIALGGVIPEYFPKLYDTKFAGTALLGYLWSPKTSIESKINDILFYRNKIR